MEDTIGILGAGGHAREVASYSNLKISFNAVSEEYLDEGLVDLSRPNEREKNTGVVAAIGAPLSRKEVVSEWVGSTFVNVIADSGYLSPGIKLGVGIQIAPQSVIMNECTLGNHVIVNTAATISHGCVIGEFATISPGVHLGGGVQVGEGVFIGIGAIVRDGLKIAPGAVLGAGAVLIKDADVLNGVYVGNPAKLIKKNPGWLNEI